MKSVGPTQRHTADMKAAHEQEKAIYVDARANIETHLKRSEHD